MPPLILFSIEIINMVDFDTYLCIQTYIDNFNLKIISGGPVKNYVILLHVHVLCSVRDAEMSRLIELLPNVTDSKNISDKLALFWFVIL